MVAVIEIGHITFNIDSSLLAEVQKCAIVVKNGLRRQLGLITEPIYQQTSRHHDGGSCCVSTYHYHHHKGRGRRQEPTSKRILKAVRCRSRGD
jgi:hypothetical protein